VKSSIARKVDRDAQAFPVNYWWTGADGVRCSGHSVSLGRDRKDAERRFFNQNRHVQPEGVAR
jgi:hypothetical protein